MIKERSIVVSILLTLITCGIYGIYWFITLTDDAAKAAGDTDFTGVKAFLFTLITCGIYGIYWYYKMGKTMYIANQKAGINASDNSLLYLLLGVLSFGIISYCIIQSELNTIARTQNGVSM